MSFFNKSIQSISIDQKFVLSKHTYLSKKIVYISNIPNSLFTKDILYQKKYFGQYGHIKQMILNINKKKLNCAIVHFDTINQASLSVLSLHNFQIDNNILQINYFITKYCHNFLKNKICNEHNCMFLHEIKINDYSFVELKNKKNIDSYKFALEVLHIEKEIFENIYRKLIGENYYQKHKKFPKMTMKKLKNIDYINNLLKKDEKIDNSNLNYLDDYQYNNNKSSQNSIDQNQKSTTDNSSDFEKTTNETNYIFKNKEKSRFNFVNLEKKDNLSVFVPEKVLDFIDKTINLYLDKKNNFNDKKNNININDYNFKWFELIKMFDLYN
jgi:hypothetical protein